MWGRWQKGDSMNDIAVEAWRDCGNRVANIFGARSNSDAARKEFVDTEQPALLPAHSASCLPITLNKSSALDIGFHHFLKGLQALHLLCCETLQPSLTNFIDRLLV